MLRIGQGFDLHKLVDNRQLILGGVNIPFDKGLLGHSDADVLIHAIIDAILGALNLGDIGTLFPDNDTKFKDIDSRVLLRQVKQHVNKNNYRLINIDSTIIIEKPKLSPYIEKIKATLALDLELEVTQVSVKAKTSEGIGIVGTGEAVVAQSVVLLERLS